jgi:hypothetical protein
LEAALPFSLNQKVIVLLSVPSKTFNKKLTGVLPHIFGYHAFIIPLRA